jgi:hypothetical protein
MAYQFSLVASNCFVSHFFIHNNSISKAGKLCPSHTIKMVFWFFSIMLPSFEKESYIKVTLSQLVISSLLPQALKIKTVAPSIKIRLSNFFILGFI